VFVFCALLIPDPVNLSLGLKYPSCETVQSIGGGLLARINQWRYGTRAFERSTDKWLKVAGLEGLHTLWFSI
jgi:hypothetical protein